MVGGEVVDGEAVGGGGSCDGGGVGLGIHRGFSTSSIWAQMIPCCGESAKSTRSTSPQLWPISTKVACRSHQRESMA